MGAKATIINCRRCGGAGIIAAYKSVNGGECFDCGGSGKETVLVGSAAHMSAESIARMNARIDLARRVGDRLVAALEAIGVEGHNDGDGQIFIGEYVGKPLPSAWVGEDGISFDGKLLAKGLTYGQIAEVLTA